MTLESRVAALAAHIIASDPDPATLRERQVACLVDEAGKLLHEVRRLFANTRSRGSLEDVAGEMADVVLAGHVTASVLGFDAPALDQLPVRVASWWAGLRPVPLALTVVRHSLGADGVLGEWRRTAIHEAVWAVRVLATVCEVDLEAAVVAKLAVIEERLGVPVGGAA